MLALIIYPVSALLAVTVLLALAPKHEPVRYVLPAVRTTALLAVAVVYVAAIWSW